MKVISLEEFLKLEKEHRLAKIWWNGRYSVRNDNDVVVEVAIKSHGLYNQRLFFNGDSIDHSLGHTCRKVTELRSKLCDKINSFGKVTNDPTKCQNVEQVFRPQDEENCSRDQQKQANQASEKTTRNHVAADVCDSR